MNRALVSLAAGLLGAAGCVDSTATRGPAPAQHGELAARLDAGEVARPVAPAAVAGPDAATAAPPADAGVPEPGPDAAVAGPDAGAPAKAKGAAEKPKPEPAKPAPKPKAGPSPGPPTVSLGGTGSMGKVSLDHRGHQGRAACTACHHGLPPGGKVEGCGKCHGKAKDGAKPSLKDAAHTQCKGCHQTKGGPTKCAGCHQEE